MKTAIWPIYPLLNRGIGGSSDRTSFSGLSWQYFFRNEASESTQDWDIDPLEASLGFHFKRLDVQLGTSADPIR